MVQNNAPLPLSPRQTPAEDERVTLSPVEPLPSHRYGTRVQPRNASAPPQDNSPGNRLDQRGPKQKRKSQATASAI